jgi:DNA helicase II / ATP-dependent DNA helicase PcrA
MPPSEQQEKAIFAKDGSIYVKASAGSGKTRVLTERIRYLIGKTKRKILALTFTNKAAEEIKDRLIEIPDINNRLFIGTFHGFCQYVLENHGSLIGLSKMPHIFEEESDRLKLVEEAIQQIPSFCNEYIRQPKRDQRDFCYRALNFISQAKRNLISIETQSDDHNIILLYENYQDILNSQDAIDFDDILSKTYELFTNYPKISALYRRSYQYICIDEAQDLNNSQYQLLIALTNGEHKNVMMVGDPNQSVFAFNGSSPDFMDKRFVEDFIPEVIELKENYRCSKKVLEAANKIIPDSINLFNTPKRGEFEIIHSLINEECEAEWIIGKIHELIQLGEHDDIEGNITYEKIAILARNKYVFNKLEVKFNENGIPFHYKMPLGSIKFESEAIKIFDMALRVKLNPQDRLHRDKLIELLKITPDKTDDLESLLTQLRFGINKQVLEIVVSFNDDGNNLRSSLNKLKENLENTQSQDDNETKMTVNDIEEILKHWHIYARNTDRKSLHQFKNAMALGQTHPSAQHKGITLSTVHTMKGQEYDIVFIMGLDDETFPDYRAIRKGGVDLIQEKNNLYVAFTRAKRFLYVTYPQKRLMPWGDSKIRKISRFLKVFEMASVK